MYIYIYKNESAFARKTALHKQQATSNKQQATNNKQQAARHKAQGTRKKNSYLFIIVKRAKVIIINKLLSIAYKYGIKM